MDTFRQLAEAWEKRRERVAPISTATRYRARSLVREIGSFPLDADLDRYLEWIAKHHASGTAPSTMAARLVTGISICRQSRIFLRDKIPPERIPEEVMVQARDYARIVKASGPSRARHRSATPEELNTLIRAAQDRRGEIRLEVLIPFAVATALRRSEILRITWSDFDPKTKTLLIRHRKDPRHPTDQRIPLSPTALAILRDVGSGHQDARIFPYVAGSVSLAFSELCAAAKVRNLMFKDLRSTAAQQLFNRGWSADQVAGVTGHKTLQILLAHYASAEPERLAVRLASEERKLQ